MKLNTDVRRLVRGKREVYPTKRSMNLYFKLDRTTKPATAFLYILFALAVLLALSKVLIYDPWSAAEQLEARAVAVETETENQLLELQEYDQVREDYLRATPTQWELAGADPTEVLDLIDSVVRPAAEISQISVTDNQVLLSFSGVTLGEAADLVSRLEQSPLVTGASVDTAVTTGENQSLVEVHVYFTLAGEEESAP